MSIYRKIHKKITGMLLAVMMFLLCFPGRAFAAGSIDPEHEVSLTVSYMDNGIPITGAEFSIYLVASMDEYGEVTRTAEFSDFPVDIREKNDEAWKTLAATLEGYVLRDQISPVDRGKIDGEGLVTFPSGEKKLMPGLYLLLGSRHTRSGIVYDAQPSMVLLPVPDPETNEWMYDVTVSPKYESYPEPEDHTLVRKVLKVWEDGGHEAERPENIQVQLLQNGQVFDTVTLNAENGWGHTWNGLDASNQWTVAEKETEGYTVRVMREGITFVVTNTCVEPSGHDPVRSNTPKNPTLPQTGQLWWPVPLLVAAGLFLIVIGLLRRKGQS